MLSLLFLSSRRRHTSWPRDWSSDVCSSDLALMMSRYGPSTGCSTGAVLVYLGTSLSKSAFFTVFRCNPVLLEIDLSDSPSRKRSEERRVGRECACGGGRVL